MEGSDRHALRAALEVLSLGLEMGVAVVIGYLAGSWLDERLATEPYLTLVFMGLGVAAAFKALWRTARRHWPR